MSNSLYGAWDDQFYPDGVGAWLAKLDVDRESGDGSPSDERVLPARRRLRAGCGRTRSRLQGGDASSDSYCYP